MTASRLVNDSPNSLTQFENEPVQVARKSEIAKVKQQYPKWYQSMTPVEISEFILHGLIATPRFLLVCQHSCTRQWPKQFAVGMGLMELCVLFFVASLYIVPWGHVCWTRVLKASLRSYQQVSEHLTLFWFHTCCVATPAKPYNSRPAEIEAEADHWSDASLSGESSELSDCDVWTQHGAADVADATLELPTNLTTEFAYIHTNVHTNIHAYIHTHIHSYIHT